MGLGRVEAGSVRLPAAGGAPHGGLEPEGVGDLDGNEGVTGLDPPATDADRLLPCLDTGLTGIVLCLPPTLCLNALRLGGLIPSASLPVLACPYAVPRRVVSVLVNVLGLMLARGIALPCMTRFRLESSLDVSCLTRSVISFMSRIIVSPRRSRTALGVMPVTPVVDTAEDRFRPRVERARAVPADCDWVRKSVVEERDMPVVGLVMDCVRTRVVVEVVAEGTGEGDGSG